MVKSSLNPLKWSLCRHGSVSGSLASTSEPPRVAVPTSAPPPKASTTFQWPTLISPLPLLRPRARDEPSRVTSPSTSSARSQAQPSHTPVESGPRPPGRHCPSPELRLSVDPRLPALLHSIRAHGELPRALLFLPNPIPARIPHRRRWTTAALP